MYKPVRNEKGQLTMTFGKFKVIQKRKNFNAIYDDYNNFKCHRTSWNAATKLAELLDCVYREGYSDGRGW